MLQKIIISFFGLLSFSQVFAQINQDTIKNSIKQNPNLIIQNDTTNVESDSDFIKNQFTIDSIALRQKIVIDSLNRRKQILDSLTFLKQKLPKLMEAAIKSMNEEIVIYTDPVIIVGDSTLSNFTYRILSQKVDAPYAPWRPVIKLSGSSFRIKIDTVNKKIKSVYSPEVKFSFNYNFDERVVRMNGRKTIIKKRNKNYFKYPIDSVFFDNKGRVTKLKKYVHYYEASESYKRGASLYIDLEQVKEFGYFADGVLSSYRLTNYCDRWGGTNINEVCHIVTYTITRQGRKFNVVRKNEPENVYSDGTFIFEFDSNFDMKQMEFTNVTKKLNRNYIVELNKDRNAIRYLYKKDGWVNKTILINYNDNPNAKNKVQTTVCYFEEDGISYYQKNSTTGKSRTRNKLTMKWTPWK